MTYSSTLSCLYDEQNPIPHIACNKCGASSDFLAIGVTVDNSQVVRCNRHLDTHPGVIAQAGEVVDFNYYDCSETDKEWLNYCPSVMTKHSRGAVRHTKQAAKKGGAA